MGTKVGWAKKMASEREQKATHFRVTKTIKELRELANRHTSDALDCAARRDFRGHDAAMARYRDVLAELRSRDVATVSYDLGAHVMDCRRRDAFEKIGRMLA